MNLFEPKMITADGMWRETYPLVGGPSSGAIGLEGGLISGSRATKFLITFRKR